MASVVESFLASARLCIFKYQYCQKKEKKRKLKTQNTIGCNNLGDKAKLVLRGMLLVINTYIKKKDLK
jgi:hypothetical protein